MSPAFERLGVRVLTLAYRESYALAAPDEAREEGRREIRAETCGARAELMESTAYTTPAARGREVGGRCVGACGESGAGA